MKIFEKLIKKKANKASIGKENLIRFLVYVGISLLISLVFYFTTKNIVFALILFVIYLLFFIIFIEKMFLRYQKLTLKTRECIKFINNFIITLSINNSLQNTFSQIEESLKGELKEQVNALSNLNVEDKLEYLKDYFKLNIYDVFLKLINQYIFNGGDILKISQLLLFDSRKLENTLDNYNNISLKKIAEFISLWGLTLLILVIIQFSLNMFYDKILNLSFFMPSIFVFFLILLVFLFLLLKGKFDVSFINEVKEEKNV